MIIKGMPILNARTRNLDFRLGKLLVKPEDRYFTQNEIDSCYRLTQDSMTYPELAPKEGRLVIYGNGKFLIIGKMVVFKNLYSACPSLTPKYTHVDNQKGKLAWGFIGAAFKLDGADKIEVPASIPDESLLKIYEDSIASRWNDTLGTPGAYDSTSSKMVDIEVKILEKCTDPNFEVFLEDISTDKKFTFEDSLENRKKLTYFSLTRALAKEKISFCTSLYTKTAIGRSCFNLVTCRKEDLEYFDKINDNNENPNTLENEQNPSSNFNVIKKIKQIFLRCRQRCRQFLDCR